MPPPRSSMPPTSQPTAIPGPPYPIQVQALGGLPSVTVDVPLASVFILLFIGSAVGHMTIFQLNKRRGHKFLMNGMMFGFSMSRIITMVLRLAWACHPDNISLGIAAQIFVAAGVLLLFVVNLLFTQRIVRALHPKFGWSMPFAWFFKVLYALLPCVLVINIVTTVQSFYTLSQFSKTIDHDIQLGSQTYLLFTAFLPIPLTYIAITLPDPQPLEKFGTGRWGSKVNILMVTSVLLSFGAGWRVGTNFVDATPVGAPSPWYLAKGAFWTVNFTIEVIVVYAYLFVRVDQRFYVPDGSRQLGGFAAAYAEKNAHQNPHGRSDSDDSLPDQKEDPDDKREDEGFDKSFVSLPYNGGPDEGLDSKATSFVSLPALNVDAEAAARNQAR